jgi:uncharacterized integral membrane protein (TIGR00698 family)
MAWFEMRRTVGGAPLALSGRPRAGANAVLPGLALCGLLAGLATALARWPTLQNHGGSALTLAIVLGMVVGHGLTPAQRLRTQPGAALSRQNLLRAGVMLYGLRLTLHDVGQLGLAGVLVDLVMVGSTFGLALWAGTRWCGLDRSTAALIGAGSAICGAAAVMATAPVLRARAEQVTVAVSTVVVFGSLAIGLYPALYAWPGHSAWLPGSASSFGHYIGATVHEVAQVVAAAGSISPAAADAAVVAKMVRVMLLAPFLLGLSALWRPANDQPQPSQRAPITVPWFAVGFLALVGLHSAVPLPAPLQSQLLTLDTALLATAMAGLGLGTEWRALRQAGWRPLLLAAGLMAWLVLGGALVSHWLPAWLPSLQSI